MSTADTPVALITTAHRDGSGGPSPDRVFVGTCAVAVLDGASEPSERDGGWLADQLGIELMHRLEKSDEVDLADALRDAIAAVAGLIEPSPRQPPSAGASTTVSIVRWSATTVDILVLGASPVVGRFRDGSLAVVRGDRLGELDGRPAVDAVRAIWPAGAVEAVLLLTDGAADGVDVYGVPDDWSTAIDMATDNPQRLLDTIHAAEAWDAERTHWPRAKPHGDKATALIKFV
jgi:hypothetical protein